MKIKSMILKFAGIILFIVILSKIDLKSFFGLLMDINLYYFIAAALLLLPMIVIKAYRWNYLKKIQNINYKLSDSILMYGSGLYIGLLTPGRIGDFIKVLYLKNDGNSVGKSFVSVFIDRIADLLFLIIFGYIGMFFFIHLFRKQVYILSFIFIIFLLIIIFAVTNKKTAKGILRNMFRFFIPEKYKEKIKVNFNDFYNDLKLLDKNKLYVVSLLTLSVWLIYFTQTFLLAMALHINISFVYLSICAAIAGLITLIPVSISGIGTRDITLIVLFSFLGISRESAVAVSMLILSMSVVMAIIGLACWLKKPVRFSKAI